MSTVCCTAIGTSTRPIDATTASRTVTCQPTSSCGETCTPRRSVASTPRVLAGAKRWLRCCSRSCRGPPRPRGRPRPRPRRRGARSPARRRSPGRGSRGRGRGARRACRGRPRGRRRCARPRRRAGRTTSGRRRAAPSGWHVPPSPAQTAQDRLLDARVDRGGRVVEDEDGRPADQRAGEREALALAARQVGAALAEGRVEATGQGPHDVVDPGQAQRVPHRVVVGCSRLARRRRA